VWLPNDRRPGTGAGESSTIICTDAIDDRRELTLLERLEDADARGRCPFGFETNFPAPLDALVRRFTDVLYAWGKPGPRLYGVCFCDLPIVELPDGPASAAADPCPCLRFPFLSSLNHSRNAVSRFARWRCEPELALTVSSPFPKLVVDIDARTSALLTPGEFAGVGGAWPWCDCDSESRDCPCGWVSMAHGEPMAGCGWCRSSLGGGVEGSFSLISFDGRRGGDLVNLEAEAGPWLPLPCELLVSSPTVPALPLRSGLSSLSFSLSLNASLDFFFTSPAASSAVVARWPVKVRPKIIKM
jgi:hypothetical protein